MNFQALKPATLSKVTPAKVFSCEFCEVFKIYFLEYLQTTAPELVRY